MKEFKEIKKLLGTEYHLGVKIGIEKNSWKLFRNYIDTIAFLAFCIQYLAMGEKINE